METAFQRPRTRRLPGCGCLAIVLGCSWSTYAGSASCETKSDLSEVIEEAKRPADEQYVVLRESPPGDDDDFDLSFLFAGCWSSHPESASASTPLFDRAHVSLVSVYLMPGDRVLTSLRGGGISLRGSRSVLELEVAAYLMRGAVQRESEAYDGLAAPYELAGALQMRVNLPSNHLVGTHGLLGIQYGHLFWRYPNSVFAVDVDGYGAEIRRDSIGSVSGFVGVGISPIQTPTFLLGMNVRVGRRMYFTDTVEGFRNDVFGDGWFSQVGVELAFRL